MDIFIRVGIPFLFGIILSIIKMYIENKRLRRDLMEEFDLRNEKKEERLENLNNE